MKNKYELKSLITLAIDILQNETEYIFYRKVIDRIFEETRKNFYRISKYKTHNNRFLVFNKYGTKIIWYNRFIK